MSRALTVERIDLQKMGLWGSSHLKYFKSTDPYSFFQHDLHKFSGCHSYGGFQMMDISHQWHTLRSTNKSGGKIKQFKDFQNDLAASEDTAAFFVFLSNDWKCFLSKNGTLIGLTDTAINHWNQLPKNKRCQYDAFQSSCPLEREGRIHLQDQFKAYKEILKLILSTSDLETVFHCSVLERLNNEHHHLDLRYAILNSYLSHNLSRWSKTGDIKNKHGKSISFNFINAQRLFHKYDDPRSIFDQDEVRNWRKREKTHRHVDAYREILDLLKKRVKYNS